MMTGSICLSKIDKSRITTDANGNKYLEIVVLESSGGAKKFSDWMIIESIKKEERDAGKKGTIIGNLKNLPSQGGGSPQSEAPPVTADDLPF